MQENNDLRNIRKNYELGQLLESNIDNDPFRQFTKWFDIVIKKKLIEPNAMILATSTKKGIPSVRTVLLKEYDQTGFIFYTNYNSRKGKDLTENHFASVLFLWLKLERQVRIEGKVVKLTKKESLEYFNQRPLKSRYGALASNQSEIISDRKILEARFKKLQIKYGDNPPMPKNWGGYKLIPNKFELWQGRSDRLHDRICYEKSKSGWKIYRLQP
jgi:pyridoxamine 5'-phosphate oxidase